MLTLLEVGDQLHTEGGGHQEGQEGQSEEVVLLVPVTLGAATGPESVEGPGTCPRGRRGWERASVSPMSSLS